jgi:hypothetical protein
MDARDRRTVHMALAEDNRVSTSSEGENEARHVVVIPGGRRQAVETTDSDAVSGG